MIVVHLLMQYLPNPHIDRPRPEREWQDVFLFFLGNAMLYLLVAGLSVAIKMTNSWYKVQSDKTALEKERAEAELKNLKSQLNPHFLFNTLNNIYSLISFSPERAQGAVHELSKLLRYVLYENNQHFVPLEKELDFLHNYIELMRIRLPEQVKLETARCLGCGASVVDPNKCIGCGVCTTKCEFDAIHLYREHPECSKMMKAEDKMKGILPYMLKREFKIRFTKKEQ